MDKFDLILIFFPFPFRTRARKLFEQGKVAANIWTNFMKTDVNSSRGQAYFIKTLFWLILNPHLASPLPYVTFGDNPLFRNIQISEEKIKNFSSDIKITKQTIT